MVGLATTVGHIVGLLESCICPKTNSVLLCQIVDRVIQELIVGLQGSIVVVCQVCWGVEIVGVALFENQIVNLVPALVVARKVWMLD